MRAMFNIAAKEFRGYFIAPMAYVVILFFLGVSGLIFVLTITMPQAVSNNFRGVMSSMVFITLMMAPVLTMSLLALEKGRGTLELLMTRPVSDWSIVLGKYLAAVGLYLSLLIVTLLFPLLMSVGGQVEWGTVFAGYVGILALFSSFGVVHSALPDGAMYLPWQLATPTARMLAQQFALGYLLLALLLLALARSGARAQEAAR